MTNNPQPPVAKTVEPSSKDDVIHIQMFGDLVIRYRDKTLSGNNARAKRVWRLLEYLLAHRRQEHSASRLIDALWGDDLDDPANALKNLAYRLRTILKNTLGSDNDYILYQHGAYTWNPDLPCVVDVDEFEQLIQTAETETDHSKRKYLLEQALSYYKGQFLPQACYQEWAIPQTVYYEKLYMESVEALCQLLLEDGDYKKVQVFCHQAIAEDPFIEKNHELLLQALIAGNEQKKAKSHYNELCKLYFDELGVQPSAAITNLYQQVIDRNLVFEESLAVIKSDLNETMEQSGALCCNYEMFKLIYRLQARAAIRNGNNIFVALLTVAGTNNQPIPDQHIKEIITVLENCITQNLRKDDVVTRYGQMQFLLMLSNINKENTNMVLQRLIKRIRPKLPYRDIEIFGQLEALDPIEQADKKTNKKTEYTILP